MRCFVTRPVVASVTVLVAASLAVGGCGSTGNSSTANCLSKSVQSAASGAAADWTLPGGQSAEHAGRRQPDHQLECLAAGRRVVRADRVDG